MTQNETALNKCPCVSPWEEKHFYGMAKRACSGDSRVKALAEATRSVRHGRVGPHANSHLQALVVAPVVRPGAQGKLI